MQKNNPHEFDDDDWLFLRSWETLSDSWFTIFVREYIYIYINLGIAPDRSLSKYLVVKSSLNPIKMVGVKLAKENNKRGYVLLVKSPHFLLLKSPLSVGYIPILSRFLFVTLR